MTIALVFGDESEHFFGMFLGLFDGRPVLDHVALRPDDYRGADRPLNFLAVHHFLAKRAVFFHHFGIRIGQKHVGQLVLFGELVMAGDAILANA